MVVSMNQKDTGPMRQTPPPPAEVKALNALYNAQRFSEVESRAIELLRLYPDAGLVWELFALSLQMQGKDALHAFQKTAELMPDDAGAQYNLGAVLKNLRRFDEAAASYRRAIKLKPDYAEAHSNLGNVLKEQGQFGDAATSYRQALRIKPDSAAIYLNLAGVLTDMGQLDDAEACLRRALELKPDYSDAHSSLLFALNHTDRPPEIRLEEARCYGSTVAGKVTAKFSAWNCGTRPERLRVGLVSGDLRNHSVGHFLESLLSHIDPNRIELIAYPTNNKEDEVTERIRPYFSAWKPINRLVDQAAAQMIHTDGVHVLLDLSGHTIHNRLPVFAWKPAPVQAGWLGYLATTGVAEMDYLLADEVGVPENLRQQFTESVWYLPDTMFCFTPPKVDLQVAPLPALSNGYVTFASFQSLPRINDQVLATWGDIFAALPDAKLRIQCKQLGEASQREQLAQRLQRYGISPDRVMMHGPSRREDYLATYAGVDLILDTFPYSGCTTTSEALWMGVPTLTLAGNTLLARQGASVLAAAGLENWVTSSKSDYISKALSLTADIPMLAGLRAGLREQALSSPLYDAERFARNFEDALWGMWQAHIQVDVTRSAATSYN
jgi:protein O-GlcNAc transferase